VSARGRRRDAKINHVGATASGLPAREGGTLARHPVVMHDNDVAVISTIRNAQ